MCGIVGYIGPRDATPIILNGLKRLEYRGYDSAGIAVLQNGGFEVRRDAGKLHNLLNMVEDSPLSGKLGIGHTRWATHGEPNARNAHPHMGATGDVVLVHNGIVENYIKLREEMIAEGIEFKSDTDSEIIVHLVESYLSTGVKLEEAARSALSHLKGHHGVVMASSKEPDKIVAARIGNAGGVVIGFGENEMFIASDMPAILEHTREVVFLESQQIATITKDGAEINTLEGEKVEFSVDSVSWDPISAEKGEYRHFMQKEIHEQIRSLTDTISGRVDFETGKIILPQLNLTEEFANKIERIVIVACGTAAYAAMVGKVLIEKIARIPVEVDIASEFRYRDPIINENTVVMAISQSGETADTLAAMAEGKSRGATLWSIVNVIGSQAMRISDGVIPMQSGPEIGVASTKAYTAPLIDQYLLAILLADLRGVLSEEERIEMVNELRSVPDLADQILGREEQYKKVALALKDTENCIYLGRGINMPTAYEGALKLKEISYIHAEGYPGGEMKHGPIALFDEDMPVIVIAPKDPWYEKMLSQIEQTKARNAPVIVLATDGDEQIPPLANQVMWIPETSWMLSPVFTVIPLQILAYHIAVLRGLDVDQPRNLAKSVTVE
ncbi:MAG: glutamine--fructose-6-phosphate transaminase (isomerizing) [Chloroflexi bacterium]|jgi:glutamine---fructose-6-phosphate transaminase (isomerizing)|nr:glutamine--fructose-6-phosphate transaminase (isomerizing) [Chloroflexota bacterium]MBT3668782.1 glutamine--fructose-6-phosphate transaminase (isomerizing) [Chloroflexota bacterium]MBT4002906.1 glutamine--fructose-6-phosphate transaminase (isomerizing) [Chloroflexota bacterium]MBT4306797.1 glutamine--fructose-6-phosphate transaminase (isomerizing) [Chloroflexota bacterium]MBT4534593.1 glutamine--fructose-6-phosphate transaminase (isomerizing) [Chloroflexota bacterium]